MSEKEETVAVPKKVLTEILEDIRKIKRRLEER
jgi:hypothetical protein